MIILALMPQEDKPLLNPTQHGKNSGIDPKIVHILDLDFGAHHWAVLSLASSLLLGMEDLH